MNKMKRNTPIDEDVLDYLIAKNRIAKVKEGQISPKDPIVIALYDYLHRWFSKSTIIERIVSLSFKGRNELDPLLAMLNEQKVDALNRLSFEINNTIDIDDEIMVEVNNLCSHGKINLCRRRKLNKVLTLLNYLKPQEVAGDAIWFNRTNFHSSYHLVSEGLPREMVSFWWKQDGKLNAVCYRSTSNDDGFINNILFGVTGNINKEKFLQDVVGHSGNDYAMVFRMEGDTITNGNPPIIKHNLVLKPISIINPFIIGLDHLDYFMQNDHVVIEKYYALYHSGNKKAEEALRRSRFNLKA